MVALEEDGYIHRPHVSAGGVPLDRGYRQFVSSLDPDVELDPVSAALVDKEFGTVQGYEVSFSSEPTSQSPWRDTAAHAIGLVSARK